MPKQAPILFDFQELAEILARKAGVKKGHWGIYVRFGLAASNIGPDAKDMKPAAIVPVVEIGIQEFETPSNLTIDASGLDKKGAKRS